MTYENVGQKLWKKMDCTLLIDCNTLILYCILLYCIALEIRKFQLKFKIIISKIQVKSDMTYYFTDMLHTVSSR